MFEGELSIRQWVQQAFPSQLDTVVDSQLLQDAISSSANLNEVLPLIFELGLLCTTDSPDQRMSMSDVVVTLKKIKMNYTKFGISKDTMSFPAIDHAYSTCLVSSVLQWNNCISYLLLYFFYKSCFLDNS